jgi:hypothetical protein
LNIAASPIGQRRVTIENLDAKHGVAMFQGAMFEACLTSLFRRSVCQDQVLSFVGRPPLRSRGTPFQMSRATFRDRLKWLMAARSSTSRPALFRSALSAFRLSSMNARTSPSEGRRADTEGREVGSVRVAGSGQHRLQSSARTDRFDQKGRVAK